MERLLGLLSYDLAFIWIPIRDLNRSPSRATTVRLAKYVLGLALLLLLSVVTSCVSLGVLALYCVCLFLALTTLGPWFFFLNLIAGVLFTICDLSRGSVQRAVRLLKGRIDRTISNTCIFLILVTVAAVAVVVLVAYRICFENWKNLIASSIEQVAAEVNAAVYLSSTLASGEIRLIEILPGSFESKIKCKLVTVNLLASKYEALSYSWGGIYGQQQVQVNGHNLVVGANLYNALRYLRHANNIRTVWVDAICINQRDVEERNQQVMQMRNIYKHASVVLIWLGKSYGQYVELGMEYISRLAHSKPADTESIWRESDKWQQSMDAMFRADWWDRVWVLQEAVLAQRAVAHWGKHTVQFDDLCGFIANPAIAGRLPSLKRLAVFSFAEALRHLRQTESDPKDGVLAYAYMFRHRRATDARDKIYALMGLLFDEGNMLIRIDYSKSVKEVFMDFAKRWIARHRSLAVIALSEPRPISGSSWCVEWAYPYDFWMRLLGLAEYEYLSPFWSGGLDDRRWYPLQAPGRYSTAGGHPAICQTDLADPDIISVTGFTYDTIIAVGDHPSWQLLTTWWDLLAEWEDLAFRSSSASRESKCLSFNRTVTAMSVDDSTCNWKEWAPRSACGWSRHQPRPHKPQEPSVEDIMRAACSNRRFFVTSKGNFGLGPATSGVGDLVCVLLGSDVPFILARHKPKRSGKDQPNSSSVLYNFKGQAYVDGIMVYQGDIKADIKNGKVRLEEYFLL